MRETLSRMEEERQELVLRRKWVHGILMGAGLILAGRLWLLQIIHGENLRKYSEINRLKETKIPAQRGRILDRKGRILVENLQELELTLTPQYVPRREETAAKLSAILQTDPLRLVEKINQSEKQYGPFRPVVIKKHLSLKEVPPLKQLKWDWTGLDIQPALLRHYPLKKNGAHLFGYLGEIAPHQISLFKKTYGDRFSRTDRVGKSGLEGAWEEHLKGEDGFSYVEVDVHNRKPVSSIAGFLSFKPEKPRPGHSLVLTIDRKLQEKAFLSFFRKDKIGPRRGALVVLKKTGAILAWVSLPSFDPNVFSLGLTPSEWQKLAQDPSKPLINKVIQSHYAPGSLFKPFVALAGLQEKIITAHDAVESPERILFGGRFYHDYRKTGHGRLNVTQALERSANVFFYKLGMRLGMDKMADYARAFRLGQKTSVRLDGEVMGLVPDSRWKEKQTGEPWQAGENLVHAIGQGFTLVTPLQMALAYNSLAREGQLVRPFLVQKIMDGEGKTLKTFREEILYEIPEKKINRKHFQTVKKGLTQVLHGPQGTARWWKVRGITTAGKTGTSQVRSFSREQIHKKCLERPLKERHHGWFVAFAPAEDPEITVAVLTEHSCSGSSGSAPLARDIIHSYFEQKNKPTPDKEGFSLPVASHRELNP